MFGIFKKLFKKSEAPQPVAPASNRTPVEAPRAPSASPQRAAPKPQVPKLAAPAPGEDIISIPLAALVKRLPEAMQKDVASPPRASDALQLPVNFILLQMPRGEIKISFAELRQASPPEIFAESSPNDLTDISLPLDLIVPLLGPKYLNRRSNQKHIAISEDIGPVFNAPASVPKSQVEIRGLATESGESPQAAAEPPPPAPAAPIPMPALAARRAEPVIPAKAPEPAPAPAPEAAAPIRFSPPPMEPAKPKPAPASVTPIKPIAPAPIKPAPLPGTASRPAPLPGTTVPKPAPAAAATHAAPPPPPAPVPELPKMRLSPPEPAPAPAPAMPAATAPAGPNIQAAMWALMIAWPEALRKEIATKNFTQHMVAFPIGEVEQGIKAGKVTFPWASIQAWIQPAVPPGAIAFESTEPLTIPLQVVAPLFMAARKPGAAQKKVQILESIPDVFAGRPQEPEPGAAPAAPPAPAAAPAPAPGAAPAAPMPTALSPAFGNALRPKVPGPTGPLDVATLFGQPNKRSWTPVELVQNTSRLEGVAGAMIAMADGLQVASDLPSHMNGDTLAAFLPQIFARVGHYTNEIKLGDPASISFTTDQQVWQINKAGNVFLLTVGRPGETLPVAQINAVATQLERQSKTN